MIKRLTLLLSLLVLACQPQVAPVPQALSESASAQLTPTSKGEQLTPGSKGEFKLADVRGVIQLPFALAPEQAVFRFWADGVQLKPEQVVITRDAASQAWHFQLKALPVGHNIVLDVQWQALKLNVMLPELSAQTLADVVVDLHSSTAVAVARRAEEQGIRELKAWTQPELQTLLSLPELKAYSQTLAQNYIAADTANQDIFAQADVQAQIQDLLVVFLARLTP